MEGGWHLFLATPPHMGRRQFTGVSPSCFSGARASSAMAFPETLWLSPTSLAKVDNDNYRAFVIEKLVLQTTCWKTCFLIRKRGDP